MLVGQSAATTHDLVQSYWKSTEKLTPETRDAFDQMWRKWLEQGWIDGTASEPKRVSVKTANFSAPATSNQGGIELNFRRDPSIYDGQFANNAWLQELPKPLSKMTWDNPLLMSPKMADSKGIKSGDMVRVELNGKWAELPVWIQAGHPDNSVTVFLGYGRKRAGRVGNNVGFDTYQLRYSATPWIATDVNLTKVSGTYVLATTQGYQTMDVGDDHRPVVRTATLEEYKKEANFNEDKPEENETLYRNPPSDYKHEQIGRA